LIFPLWTPLPSLSTPSRATLIVTTQVVLPMEQASAPSADWMNSPWPKKAPGSCRLSSARNQARRRMSVVPERSGPPEHAVAGDRQGRP
jgi:hypothetical protein